MPKDMLTETIKHVDRALRSHGGRMERIEEKIEAAKDRLSFWQTLAVVGLGLAGLLALAWWKSSNTNAQ